jgi:hypothetical protein
MKMKKGISKRRNPDCCTQNELKKFRDRVEECISRGPSNIDVGEDAARSAYWEMLNLSEYCGCKVISILEAINMRDMWRWALSCGRLSPEQIRYIGEQKHYWGWSNLFDVLDGTEGLFSDQTKKGSGQNIFAKPYQREDVLSYMNKIKDHYVFARGIETGVLTRDDILAILRAKKNLTSSSVQWAIINTKLLTTEEVLELLGHYDGQCLDHSVNEYLKVYEPRGKELEEFLEAVVQIDPKEAGDIYDYALKIKDHGLSDEYIVGLAKKGVVKISGVKVASAC